MAEVSSAEFTEWLAYSQIERFGADMDDLRAGVIAAAIYNVHRDAKKHPKAFGPSDVIPWLGSPSGDDGAEPVLLNDATAQTNLLRATLFGGGNGKAG